MLRITVHHGGAFCRLELAGRLGCAWVAETEYVWRSALCSGKRIEIDLRQVTAIDGAGRNLLAAMHQAGARLLVQGVEMKALVDEIAASRRLPGAKRDSDVKTNSFPKLNIMCRFYG
jgi:ABC-type transporter Mla MlaB component